MPSRPSHTRVQRLEPTAYILVDSDGEMSDFEEIDRAEATADVADDVFQLVEHDPISVVRTRTITIGTAAPSSPTETVTSDGEATSSGRNAVDDVDIRRANAQAFEEMQQQLAELNLGATSPKAAQRERRLASRSRERGIPSFEDMSQRLSDRDRQTLQSRVPRQRVITTSHISADATLTAVERDRTTSSGIVTPPPQPPPQQERFIPSTTPLPSGQVVQNARALYERARDVTERQRREAEAERLLARQERALPPTPPPEGPRVWREVSREPAGILYEDRKTGLRLWRCEFPKAD